MINTFHTQIILYNSILCQGQSSYIGTFTVYLGMPLIFTDFQSAYGYELSSCWKICEYQNIFLHRLPL